MSGGTQQTTTRQQSSPWKEAQPALKAGLGDALNIYQSGQGFQPYTGSSVVPFSQQTQAGMTDIQNQAAGAMQNNPFGGAAETFGGLVREGGLNQMQRDVADQWRGTASGADQDPVFQRVREKTLEDAAHYANLGASGRGRYGSGKHADVVGRTVGDLSDRMYMGQLGRMDAARANLAGLGQQGIANQFGAVSAAPAAYSAQFEPSRAMMGVGSMYEDLMGRTMADQRRIFDETQQAPLRAVEWLNAIGSGAGALGGTSTATERSPAPNPFMQAAGVGLGAASVLRNPVTGGWF